MGAPHSPTISASQELQAIVGAEHVREAGASDALDGVQPQFVVEPGRAEEVAKVLKCANDAGLAVAPRGGGSKMAWGNRPRRCDVVLSLARMNQVLEHAAADLTVSVQAGCTFSDLQRVLASQRQRLALDPLWPERATVGGALATNDSGSLRIRFGGLRDLIIGITLALPDGTLAKSGGKVVKNVAGYDLMKLATGSLGTLAVITDAVFRLHPVFPETRSLTLPMNDVTEANKLVLAILDSKLAFTGLQIRARAAKGVELDLRFEGTAAGVSGQCEEIAKLAGKAPIEAKPEVWSARQALFQPGAVVAKFTALPSALAASCGKIAKHAQAADWEMVAQATGIGYVRIAAASADLLNNLRAELEPDGSLVLLQCPTEMKNGFDVWGWVGDSLPLMRRVKQEFDPKDTLSPGRFVGGI